MYQSKNGSGWVQSRVRYGNAVYTYEPRFKDGSFREAVIAGTGRIMTFEFQTPYVIAATPADDSVWGIYKDGCKNGLVVNGETTGPVEVSTDRGATWFDAGPLDEELDLTDQVKGHQQYWIRFSGLKNPKLRMTTICQVNMAVLPRLTDGENRIHYQASGRALTSAGPNLDQAKAQVIEGSMDSSKVVLELKSPRSEKIIGVYAASWNQSGAPPRDCRYQIEMSRDGGSSWSPVVKDAQILRRGSEPGDFWSQSFTYGGIEFPPVDGPMQIRFSNDGGRKYRKVEAHLVYEVAKPSPVTVTFGWTNGGGNVQTTSHRYAKGSLNANWTFDAGEKVETRWVEMSCTD
jgi:hypothetical protein